MSSPICVQSCINKSRENIIELTTIFENLIEMEEEELEIIQKAEDIINNKPDEYKKKYYMYILIYNNDEAIYNFEWVELTKYQIKEQIEISISDTYLNITNYLSGKKYFNYIDILQHKEFIKTHYLSGLKVPITGYMDKDLYKLTPDFEFYDLLGQKDDELTNYAEKKKQEAIEQIMKKLILTPLSLKSLSYTKCISLDIQIPISIIL
jgi:hypothetical protein